MKQLIERATEPGQVVCDPFLGGGTTASAALSTNRLFVGSDIDEDCVNITLNRIERELSNHEKWMSERKNRATNRH